MAASSLHVLGPRQNAQAPEVDVANVLVSAARTRDPRAPSVLLFDAALAGRIERVTSSALLAELASVLARPRLRRYVSLEEAERFVGDLGGVTVPTADPRRLILRSAATRWTTTSSRLLSGRARMQSSGGPRSTVGRRARCEGPHASRADRAFGARGTFARSVSRRGPARRSFAIPPRRRIGRPARRPIAAPARAAAETAQLAELNPRPCHQLYPRQSHDCCSEPAIVPEL
jgi:predicted nucleic acid-binding protein